MEDQKGYAEEMELLAGRSRRHQKSLWKQDIMERGNKTYNLFLGM